MPPVEVPAIRSKTAAAGRSIRRSISASTTAGTMPRMPPPSIERTLTRSATRMTLAGPERVAQGPPDLVRRDHAAQPAVRVDRRQAAEAAQGVVAEQRFERRVVAHPGRSRGVEL